MKPHTPEFLQRRKFIMVLPLLVLPFITMLFWVLGGGQGSPVQAKGMEFTGLNVSLPDAQFSKKEIWDKLSLYEMAARDSVQYEQARERDPYFDLIAFKTEKQQQPEKKSQPDKNKLIDSFPHKEKVVEDPNEERVNKKLDQLYTEINRASATPTPKNIQLPTSTFSDPQFTSDIDRLERMMEMMGGNGEPDPEMQQIESVLEKILDIQHPERVKEKYSALSQQRKVNTFPVERVSDDDPVSWMTTPRQSTLLTDSSALFQRFAATSFETNGFFGLEDEVLQGPTIGNAIEAVIHDTQELVAGATVRIRLLNDILIQGHTIPKDQFVYGVCAINNERLTIEINSIRTGNTVLPVSLTVYDLDGLAGIYIPGAISRDAAKQASDNALQNIQLMSLDPSIGAQAAAAGVEAAKGLLSKKAKMIKVTVKAGYRILLLDKNLNHQ